MLELITKPRVLVTGATGLVGRAIVRRLLEARHVVRVLVRSPGRAQALFASSVEVTPGDLQHLEHLRVACQGIDEVYHVAGVVDIHEHEDTEILDTNVDGTQRLLKVAVAAGVSGFVYTSSVAVYGDRLPLGLAEDAPLRPTGIYGISKVRAERAVHDAIAAGFRAMIVRPCIVYGPGDRYFVPQAMRIMRLPVIPLPDGGRHLVDVVHADDLAAAHLLTMEVGQTGQAYNVTDGGRHQAGELIRWMAAALHRSPWMPPIPQCAAACFRRIINVVGRLSGPRELTRLGRQELDGVFSDYHFDILKITALGYAPQIDAREGLQKELRARADASSS